MRLVLASASPRRRELLTAAGFTFETIVTDIDELVQPGEGPDAYVSRVAREKTARALEMLAASGPSGDVVVLGADTSVVIDGEILGKPVSDADGRRMLERLSGRVHQVLTGLNLRSANLELSAHVSTDVWFSEMTSGDIDWYVATGEGRDKAGGYAIQGLASRFIPRIEGSYSNVVGLPVETFWRLLRRFECEAGAVASRG